MTKFQDWTVGENGEDSPEFVRIQAVIAELISKSITFTSRDFVDAARYVVSQLAFKQGYLVDGSDDWTVNPDNGRANDSRHYLYCVDAVERHFQMDWFPLVMHNKEVTLRVAGEIIRTLAREYRLVPPPTPTSS